MTDIGLISRLEARTEKRIVIPELGECWLYTGGSIDHDGYGRIEHMRKWMRVHRAAYIELVESVPITLNILHECDQRTCWRPEHLYKGTQRDNLRDRVSRNPNSWAKGQYASNSKLTEEQVLEIRHVYATTRIGMGKLANRYSVGLATISDIIHRKTWAHI